MRFTERSLSTALGVVLLSAANQAAAQTATVNLASQKQYIRGFGGMSHAAWAGDLTAAERTLAFSNGTGQLGFSVLRIPVTDGSADSSNVATAKAALAAGAIVYATPWNSSGAMDSSQFSTYATHLNDFVSYMKNQGVDLYAIGTQNEPDYGSEGGWRTWTADQCHDFMLNYGSKISTKLISCESFSYKKSYYDPILNDSAALANMGILGTHLYGTQVSDYAYSLADTKAPDKERWMTEHYTDSNTNADSWPNALNVATEMHNCMVQGVFNAYTWWYIKRSYGPIYNGAVTKRGYSMGQFSKFIRPGYHRVDATASPTSGVYVSAYTGDSNVVIVVVNSNTSTKSLTVTVSGSDVSSYDRYTTSSSKSLTSDGKVTASGGSLSLSLDASSVTTLVGTGSGGTGAGGGTGAAGSGGGSGSGGGGQGSGGASSTGGGGDSTGTGGKATGAGGASSSGSTGKGGASAGASIGAGGSTTATSSGGGGSTAGSGGGSTGTKAPNSGGAGSGTSPLGSGGSQASSGTTSGTAAAGSTPSGTGSDGSSQDGGCSCNLAGRSSSPLALLGMLGMLALGAMRRKPRGRA